MSLQGTLKTLGITEVLEFMAERDATGQLDVNTDQGSVTYLFSHGHVAQAEYSFSRETGTDSAEATYYVVSELDGTFFFDEDHEPVEAVIETPHHVLTRNDELDGSVTIEPEWWKAFEVIGTGKSSLEVAAQLNMGLLDASMLLLSMSKAGLLHVQETPAHDSIDEVDTVQPDTDIDVASPFVASLEQDVEIQPEVAHRVGDPAPAPMAEAPPVEPLTVAAPPVEALTGIEHGFHRGARSTPAEPKRTKHCLGGRGARRSCCTWSTR